MHHLLESIKNTIHIIIPFMLAIYLITIGSTIGYVKYSHHSSPTHNIAHPSTDLKYAAKRQTNETIPEFTLPTESSSEFFPEKILDNCDFDDFGNPIQISQGAVWFFAYLLGGFGVARFITGYTCFGVMQCLSCGCCGVWWLVDLVLIAATVYTEANGCPLNYDVFFHQT